MDSTGTTFLPPSASTFAPDVDALLAFITYVSLFFMVVIFASVILFIVKYRRRSQAPQNVTHPEAHLPLEILWTAIPLFLVLVIFTWGFRIFLRESVVPSGSLEVKVTAQQWAWLFEYPNGAASAKTMVVPVNRNIKLLMSSKDVIHSFFVPAFRIKKDVLPNRYTIIWFKATKVGVYDLFCAEYCGLQHSGMIGSVRVVPEEEYTAWLEANKAPEGAATAEVGKRLYELKGCFGCHTTDGSHSVGPSFKGVFGHKVSLKDGSQVTADENYLRESILDPGAKVVGGFQPVMPTYQGQLKPQELDALIAFIKSLSE
jgi:cytochrome c oxidase subunit 2